LPPNFDNFTRRHSSDRRLSLVRNQLVFSSNP